MRLGPEPFPVATLTAGYGSAMAMIERAAYFINFRA
jgi:hypothetical protein